MRFEPGDIITNGSHNYKVVASDMNEVISLTVGPEYTKLLTGSYRNSLFTLVEKCFINWRLEL